MLGPPTAAAEQGRITLVGLEAAFVESFVALAETEGWEALYRRPGVSPTELAGLGLRAAVLDADKLGPRLWDHIGALRAGSRNLGLIVVSARSTRRERVLALRAGVDFWAPPGVDAVELMALVLVSVRTLRGDVGWGEPVSVGDLRLASGRLLAGGAEVVLTRRELIMLNLLVTNQGLLLARETIFDEVRGGAMAAGDRSVDVVIARLRRKLERASPGYDYIHTHYRIGYRFEAIWVERPEPHVGFADETGRPLASGQVVGVGGA